MEHSPLATLLSSLGPEQRRRASRAILVPLQRAKKAQLRSRLDFALEELVIPEGVHKGELLLPEFQPYAVDLLAQMDATSKRHYAVSGCVQSGKTLIGLVATTCWHLFELGHTVIYGVPEMKMARKKWLKELLPVIQMNPRLRRHLPKSGSGSQGGFDGSIHFENGATLEFMGATGNDSRRSSSTAQVLVKTEVDRFDEASDSSREASPAETMEDRVASFGDDAYIYEECTRTTTRGRINVMVNAGTRHRPHAPCPYCKRFVYPTREHLVGFEDADDIEQAIAAGCFVCPACASVLSEQDRFLMQTLAVSCARTQSVEYGPDGLPVVMGELPPTHIFSYEWNGFFNRFWSTEKLVRWEWQGLVGANDENEQKQSNQKRWSVPVDPGDFELEPLTSQQVYERHAGWPRGVLPPDATCVTAGIDVRKTQLHYVLVAWRPGGAGHVFDYGIWDVPWRERGVREGISSAVVELTTARFAPGFVVFAEDGSPRARLPCGYKLWDLGYEVDSVREGLKRLTKQGVKRLRGVLGRGQSEPPGRGSYVHPDRVSEERPWIGENCHLRRRADLGVVDCIANSDEWKTFVRRGVGADTPAGSPGSLSAWRPQTADEKRLARDFAQQICVETQVVRRVPRRGEVIVWEHLNYRPNHFGDALYYACVAGHLEGVRVAVQPVKQSLSGQIAAQPLTPASPFGAQ